MLARGKTPWGCQGARGPSCRVCRIDGEWTTPRAKHNIPTTWLDAKLLATPVPSTPPTINITNNIERNMKTIFSPAQLVLVMNGPIPPPAVVADKQTLRGRHAIHLGSRQLPAWRLPGSNNRRPKSRRARGGLIKLLQDQTDRHLPHRSPLDICSERRGFFPAAVVAIRQQTCFSPVVCSPRPRLDSQAHTPNAVSHSAPRYDGYSDTLTG